MMRAKNIVGILLAASFAMACLSGLASTQSAEDPGAAPAITNALIDANGLRKINDIQFPLATLPAIVEDGTELKIELLSNPGDASGVTVKLTPCFSSLASKNVIEITTNITVFEKTASEYWVGEYAKQVYVVSVTIPTFDEEPRLAECMYNLDLSWTGGADAQPHSVKVIDYFKEDYSYVVVADFHTGDPRAMGDARDPDEFQDSWGKYWSLDAQLKSIAEINALNPEFVICPGDIVYGQTFPNEYGTAEAEVPYEAGNEQNYMMGNEYELFYGLQLLFEVPVYYTIGNHDGYVQGTDDGYEYWKAMIGPLYYSFDYGATHYVAPNTYDWSELDRQGASAAVSAWGGQVRPMQLEWLKSDLAAARGDEGIEDIVCFSHHSPSWPEETWYGKDATGGVPGAEQADRGVETLVVNGDQLWTGCGRDPMLDLCRDYDVSFYFAGHTHWDEINVTERTDINTTFVITTTVSSGSDQYWGYRYVEVENGSITNFVYDITQGQRDEYLDGASGGLWEGAFSIPLYNFDVEYRLDVSSMMWSAVVKNGLNQDFENVKVRLSVPASEMFWKVEGDFDGRVLNRIRGSSVEEVEVIVSVPALSEGAVHLAECDTDPYAKAEDGTKSQETPGFGAFTLLAAVGCALLFFGRRRR